MKHLLFFIMLIVTASGCSKLNESHPHAVDDAESDSDSPPNILDIPASVRQSLGITFATVELRPVRQTLRLPGEFELRPEGIREHRAMAPGRVTLHVEQFQNVTTGDLLFTIDSPQWRDMQHEAVEAHGDVPVAEAALDIAIALNTETNKAASFLNDRIERLRAAGTRNVELESQFAELQNTLPRLQAEIVAKRVGLDEAREHFSSRLNTLASLSGISLDELRREDRNGIPTWRTIDLLNIRSETTGIVDSIDVTTGGWLETGDLALTLVEPNRIRFRAHALQSDVMRLQNNPYAVIVPPQGGSISLNESIEALLSIGFRASSTQRTIPLYAIPKTIPEWARPGAVAYLEVLVGGSLNENLAVPESAVIRDGLTPLLFRRDPNNPNKAIRVEADLGHSDGRWVEVLSGVREGDQIVLDGAHQLMLATSGREIQGGHIHADGTFHEDH